MKTVLVIPDGVADEAQPSLNNRTPLQAANLPNMDAVAAAGTVGRTDNVPASMPSGSDVGTMSLFGYDTLKFHTGRAPIEAAAQGIELADGDWAIRCNLVTVQDQTMKDFTADHISDDDAAKLLSDMQDAVGAGRFEFVPGVSYRNLLLYRGEGLPAPFSMETRCTPPHDLTDKTVLNDFPRGPGSDILNEFMEQSVALFADHPVNAARIKNGKLPATNVWLWGQGKTPDLTAFQELHGKTGKMITAVDLLRGIAALIGWDRIEVEGATGYTDTDYAAKGRAAIEAIDSTDIICVHIEAPDEASHEGDAEAKVKALEEIDTHIVRPLHAALQAQGDYRILVTPDHPTPIRTKTHSHGIVPLAICGTGFPQDAQMTYDEPSAEASELAFDEGFRMMSYFLQ